MCKGDQIHLLYHIHSFPNHPSSHHHDGLDSKRLSDGEDKVDEKEDNKSDGGCGDTANPNVTSCCVWAKGSATFIPSRSGVNIKTISPRHVTDSKSTLTVTFPPPPTPLFNPFQTHMSRYSGYLASICDWEDVPTSLLLPRRYHVLTGLATVTTRIQQFKSSKKAAPDGQYICK